MLLITLKAGRKATLKPVAQTRMLRLWVMPSAVTIPSGTTFSMLLKTGWTLSFTNASRYPSPGEIRRQPGDHFGMMNFFNFSCPGPILRFISFVIVSRNLLDISDPCWYIPNRELISASIFLRNWRKYSGSSVNFFLSASVKVYCLCPGSCSAPFSNSCPSTPITIHQR